MPCTVEHLAESLAEYVGESGVCPDNIDRIAKAINEATYRLIYSPDRAPWKGLIGHACFCVFDCCVALPQQFETLEAVWVNNQPVNLRNMWWEYHPGGPCLKDCCGSELKFYDLGDGWALGNDLTGNSQLIFVTTRLEDEGAHVLVRGVDAYGNPIRTKNSGEESDYLGEKVDLFFEKVETGTPNPPIGSLPKDNRISKECINDSNDFFTTNHFNQVSFLKKSKTKGQVFVYEASKEGRRLVASLAPNQTISSFRRFKLSGYNNIKHCPTQVIAKGRKRFVKVENADDEVLICNVPALQQILLSIRYEKGRGDNPTLAAFHAQQAFSFLNAELNVNDGISAFRIQTDPNWARISRIPNLL